MSRPILMLILNIIGARRLSSISIIAMAGIVPGWSRRYYYRWRSALVETAKAFGLSRDVQRPFRSGLARQ